MIELTEAESAALAEALLTSDIRGFQATDVSPESWYGVRIYKDPHKFRRTLKNIVLRDRIQGKGSWRTVSKILRYMHEQGIINLAPKRKSNVKDPEGNLRSGHEGDEGSST